MPGVPECYIVSMKLIEGGIYHIFNRGNNREVIFPEPHNYPYFIHKIGRYVAPTCDILAYCLMPTHFHFLIHANHRSTYPVRDLGLPRQRFSQAIKQLLSSYAKGINKQEGRKGSLFQQGTKSILVNDVNNDYAKTVLHYIHQNPLKAGLVSKMEYWSHSSFAEYTTSSRHSTRLCKKDLALELLDIDPDTFYSDSYSVIPDAKVSYTY